jgi:hypothetical protein
MKLDEAFDRIIKLETGFPDGRLDIDVIEDSPTRLLLASLKAGLNDLLADFARRYLTSTGASPSLYFDFIATHEVNAVAFHDPDSGIFFIGMTFGMFEELLVSANLLSKNQDIQALLGVSDDRSRNLATGLLPAMVNFVVCHELGHHALGHTEKQHMYQEITPKTQVEQFDKQANELLADRVGTGNILINLLMRNEVAGAFVATTGIDDPRKFKQATIIALSSIFLSIPFEAMDVEDFKFQKHPPAAVRLESTMSATAGFLHDHTNQTLTPQEALACMNLAASALGKGLSAGMVTKALETPQGKEYADGLTAAYDNAWKDRSKHWRASELGTKDPIQDRLDSPHDHPSRDSKSGSGSVDFSRFAAKFNAEIRTLTAIYSPRSPDLEVLYHYTDLHGLLGILKTGLLWATYAKTLNDATEQKYGQQLLQAEFERQSRSGKYRVEEQDAFVACFCESDQLLSMWRAYAGNGGGVCLGFDRDGLESMRFPEMKQAPLLSRVTYGELGPDYVDHIQAFVANAEANGPHVPSPFLSSLIKHEAFKEEREWRIVALNPPTHLIKFRPGVVSMRPYLELSMHGKPDRPLPLKSLTFGPTIRAEDDQEKILSWLLKNQGYDGVAIRPSKIPYRL